MAIILSRILNSDDGNAIIIAQILVLALKRNSSTYFDFIWKGTFANAQVKYVVKRAANFSSYCLSNFVHTPSCRHKFRLNE
jgi:hypothetical protein